MRVLVPTGGVAVGARGELDPEEAHHLRVRRARDAERVEVRDGAGLVGEGRLLVAGGRWLVELDCVERRPPPPGLTIGVGAGDRERFAWLVEKAGELGVTSIVPLETDRTAGVATRVREQHLPKLRRLGLETVKQSGAAWAVAVAPPTSLAEFLALPRDGRCWLADAAGAPPAAAIDGGPLTVAVGPEGGFSEAERDALLGAGFAPTALGPHTLRYETAALAAAAAASAARLRGAHGGAHEGAHG